MRLKNQAIEYGYSQVRIFALLLCFCLAAMSGCTVGPDYKPQQTQMPAKWSETSAVLEKAVGEDIVGWWQTFDDPVLTSLVDRAVKTNLDLKQAEARILQARAARGIAAGGLWPAADVGGSYSRNRTSGGSSSDLYQAGLDAAWEVDIFGGVHREVEAAEADIQAAVEDYRDVLVTLTAEVALNYIDLRGYQQEIVISRKNLDAQKHSAELTRKRFIGGFVGSLDVANADAQVATTASVIPLLESSARQTIYSLSVLLGLEPSALLAELQPTSEIPAAPPAVPVGVPSDLLRRRPDIRRAEAQIHSATALIGVATSDLFPKMSLSASMGLRGDKIKSLSDWNNRFWSIGPSVSWRAFDGGQIRSNIELQKAIKEQTFISYQQTVLIALQEVENALIASTKEQEHRSSLAEAVVASRKAVDLSTQLYTEGQTDFLNVLQSQRSLYVSEDALVRSNRDVSINLVALYKALGGGWEDRTVAEK